MHPFNSRPKEGQPGTLQDFPDAAFRADGVFFGRRGLNRFRLVTAFSDFVVESRAPVFVRNTRFDSTPCQRQDEGLEHGLRTNQKGILECGSTWRRHDWGGARAL